MDYSALHNSVEALAARINYDVVLSSLQMIENYFEQIRESNEYGAQAAQHTAQANRSLHSEMAEQLNQQSIEHGIHAGANGGMGLIYLKTEAQSLGPAEKAQQKVDVAEQYMNALKPGQGDFRVEADGSKSLEMSDLSKKDLTPKQKEITAPGMDYTVADPRFFDKNGKLDPKAEKAIKDLRTDVREKMYKEVKSQHRKAEKKLTNIESQKSQTYDKWRIVQQLAQSSASSATEANRSVEQQNIGKFEAMKNLAEWTNQAFQLTSQLATTMAGTLREQGVTNIANLINALTQANRAA